MSEQISKLQFIGQSIHQQGIAHLGYFDERFDEAAFGSTNLKREAE